MSRKFLYDTCPDNEFFGRGELIDYLVQRAGDVERSGPGILLTGPRWTGKSEVLRRVHARLYHDQAAVMPVYYRFRDSARSPGFAEDFLKEVLKQCLAFRNRDSALVRAEVSLERLEGLLVDGGAPELAELAALHVEAKKSGDRTAELRNALSVPRLVSMGSGGAGEPGPPVYLLLDDLDLAGRRGQRGPNPTAELISALSSPPLSFLAASSTSWVLEGGTLERTVETVTLGGLDPETSVAMMMELARSYHVAFDTEVLSFAAVKLCGNPMYMKSLLWAAQKKGADLMTLKGFIDLYATEITGGDIGFALRSALPVIGPVGLRVLHACSEAARKGSVLSIPKLANRLNCEPGEFDLELDRLSEAGLVEAGLGIVRWAADTVVRDMVDYLYETGVTGSGAEEARTGLVRDALKDGFETKSKTVGGRFKEEATALLKSFNGQKVLKVLMRNQAFSTRFKDGVFQPGSSSQKDEELTLPQIIGAFDSTRWEKNETGPPIVIARGFDNDRYESGNEVVWVAGIKDSNAPVNRGDVDNFIRRSSILKDNFKASRMMRFMIGREGFTGEARKLLESVSSFSADSTQVAFLSEYIERKQFLGARERAKADGAMVPAKEFEVVLPSSSKAELVAARAVEEITTEMGFDEGAISQIKSALVEACINAFEHSKVKGAKVYLKFAAHSDRLLIKVQNRGVDFDALPITQGALESRPGLPQKRGWGLEIMKGLMDEVRFEQITGGARIVLVKYLIKGNAG